MVHFDLKIHAITLEFAQGAIHACKVEYMSLTFKYKCMKFNGGYLTKMSFLGKKHVFLNSHFQRQARFPFKSKKYLRILESILPSISLCKNLEIVIFKPISQA